MLKQFYLVTWTVSNNLVFSTIEGRLDWKTSLDLWNFLRYILNLKEYIKRFVCLPVCIIIVYLLTLQISLGPHWFKGVTLKNWLFVNETLDICLFAVGWEAIIWSQRYYCLFLCAQLHVFGHDGCYIMY